MTIFQNISRWISFPLMAAGIALSQPALANKEVEAELMKQIKSAYVDGAYDKFNRLAAQMPEKSVFRPHVEIWQFRFFQKGVEKKFPDREVVWSKSEILPLLNKHESRAENTPIAVFISYS